MRLCTTTTACAHHACACLFSPLHQVAPLPMADPVAQPPALHTMSLDNSSHSTQSDDPGHTAQQRTKQGNNALKAMYWIDP